MAIVVQHEAVSQQAEASQIRKVPIGDSSFIQEVSYDPSTFQMTVTMKNGAQYIHWYVYPAIFDSMMQSPSKGKFYAEVIKGKHPSTRTITKNVGKAVKKAH